MELTKSFPPADHLFETLMEIDYKKHLNSFMDAVVVFCAFIAAIATVIRDKWQQYDCSERLQLLAIDFIKGTKIVYAWVMNVFVPTVKSFYDDCRTVYNFVRTV